MPPPRSLAAVAALVAAAVALVVAAMAVTRPEAVASASQSGHGLPTETAPSAADTPSRTETPLPAETPTVVASPSPIAPATDAAGVDEPITLAFTGDVHGERQIAASLAEGGRPLAAIAPALGDADLTIVNLETAVGSSGTPASKTYTFQAPPALLDELAAAGVDVVSLANNHSLDFGPGGLLETLDHVDRAGLRAIGAGSDAAHAYAPAIYDIRGRTVALVGLTRVWPHPSWAATGEGPGLAGAYDLHRAVGAVVEAKARADVVVAVIHWGTEGADCPDNHQRDLADALVAAGATAVVGHHPHVLQPVELGSGSLVAYSLGNFLWYTSGATSRLTGVLRLEISGDDVTGWQFDPAVIDPQDGGPRPASGDDAAAAMARLSRSCPPSN